MNNPFDLNKKTQEFINSAKGETSKSHEEIETVNTTIFLPVELKDRVDYYRKNEANFGETKQVMATLAIEEYIEFLLKEKPNQKKDKKFVCSAKDGAKTMLIKLDKNLNNKIMVYKDGAKAFETKNYIMLQALDKWLKERNC